MKRIFLLISILCLVFNCSCSLKKNGIKEDTLAQQVIKEYYFAYNNKVEPTLTEDMKTATPNSEFNSVQKTEEIIKTIKERPTLFEKLKAAFHELDNRNPLAENDFDSDRFLQFSIGLFKEFLVTDQSYKTSESDFNLISSNIKVFNLNNGRVFTYSGSALLFGDSGRTNFAYLQTKVDQNIKISILYEDVRKDILNIAQPFENRNLVIVTGSDRNQQGHRAFVEAFSINNGIVNKVEILKDYNDGVWCIDSKIGTIFLSNSFTTGTYIHEKPGDTIKVEAGDAKLILNYDNNLQRYVKGNQMKY